MRPSTARGYHAYLARECRPGAAVRDRRRRIDNGLDVPDTIALDYKILAGEQGILLAFDSDFGQDFLNPNEQALGHHMDSALQAGGARGSAA